MAECELATKIAKRVASRAQQKARKRFGEKIPSEERQNSVFGISKQMTKEGQDTTGVNWLNYEHGSIVIKPETVMGR